MEFIEAALNYGGWGFLGLAIAYIVVSVQAKPDTDVSFFGIKFRKRYVYDWPATFYKFRRIPSELPKEWLPVLHAFKELDSHHVHQDAVHRIVAGRGLYTVLKTKSVCIDMIKYGILKHSLNYIILTDRGIKLVDQLS